METFLKQIARRIVAEHPNDTDSVLVVFNNNRSKRFFTKQFDMLGQATFLPQVTAIDDFISQLCGLRIIAGEFLLFELYAVHEAIGGADRKYQTFEDFIPFGELMMADFSEIDQYMAPARQLFEGTHELKKIGEWDIEGSELTAFQQQYLEFYRSLFDYYTTLRAKLAEKGKAYSGMAYRMVAEDIAHKVQTVTYSDVYFVGFNALSKCEETIMAEFVRCGRGHLLTDHDPYFLEPAGLREAGYFLRRHMATFPSLRPSGESRFAAPGKKIIIVDCPENILQCKFAGQLLATHPEWTAGKEAESTAVVLCDEKLLIPTLNALPDTDGPQSVNVSMGYAFADSMVHSLVGKLFSLFCQHSAKGYYHSDIVEVLSDHFVSHLLGAPNLRRQLERLMRQGSHIRCHRSTIESLLQQAGAHDIASIGFLFPDDKPTPSQCLLILRQLAVLITATGTLDANNKEKQAMGSLAEILDNLDELLSAYPDTVRNTDTLERIYSRIASRHSISLIGDPITGLQILGMLETRNLDFKRVVLLSAGEGILPGGRKANTLIPFMLKVKAGLPTYVEKDKVYAHHFYRLLQRAEEVYLVYNTESEAMGKGEASRFLRQVESELAPRFGIEVSHLSIKADITLAPTSRRTEVAKSPSIMQRLSEMASAGLSPTSFCAYMECPLKYYYTRVLRIDEAESIDEDLDAAQLGSSIHAVLEKIYGGHIGHPLKAHVLSDALDQLPTLMEEAFNELYSGGRNTEGRNRFLYSVAESQLRHILTQEKEHLEQGNNLVVLAVEEKIEGYPLTPTVCLKGTIDRVDMLDGTFRIIDYKTGRLDDKEITYAGDDADVPGKWLQLMWYALLYYRSARPAATVNAGIYPLRNLASDVRLASWDTGDGNPQDITPGKLDLFEQMLRQHVEQLMDPAQPFVATPSRTACEYCPVRSFCDAVP